MKTVQGVACPRESADTQPVTGLLDTPGQRSVRGGIRAWVRSRHVALITGLLLVSSCSMLNQPRKTEGQSCSGSDCAGGLDCVSVASASPTCVRSCTPGAAGCLSGEVCNQLPSGAGVCTSGPPGNGTGGGTGTTSSTSTQTGVHGSRDAGQTGGPPEAFTAGTATLLNDTNGDGKLSPGESGNLKVSITNTGTAKALGITGNLTTSTAGVTITDGTGLTFSDLGAGSSACGVMATVSFAAGSCSQSSSYYPTVTLASSVTAGTTISFSLALVDEYGSAFAVSYSYAVVGINQAFTAGTATLLNDTNGDGKLSPGESGNLKVSITNTGTAKALGVTGNLTTSTAGVTITDGTGLTFSDLGAGSSACGVMATVSFAAGSCSQSSSYYPTVTLASSVTAGTTISFSLALADEYGSTFAVSYSYMVVGINQAFIAGTATVMNGTNGEGNLKVSITNTGTAKALGITGNLTTTTAGVTITGGTGLTFSDLGAGSSACGVMATVSFAAGSCSQSSSYYPAVTLATSVTAGTTISFSLAITDKYGNSFVVPFSVPVN